MLVLNTSIEYIPLESPGAGWLTDSPRLADLLATELGTANDELLYQSARKLVIIEMQNIVYTEFLPTLLGMTHLQLDNGRGKG